MYYIIYAGPVGNPDVEWHLHGLIDTQPSRCPWTPQEEAPIDIVFLRGLLSNAYSVSNIRAVFNDVEDGLDA
ncbi:hypothetical protein M404DRAFT_1005130 [Pisolithus tinctorius Marx 270]|uniref:Uncharacterized protein n=1 Tax=Pisolithus tinctorius Marx 270 TaxID=870435 RepID=A0A0C3NBZ1_PISTI|nr:hypothetical protein M404DRAFT_1005130 [Pisolithus tinctorius Marx 270]